MALVAENLEVVAGGYVLVRNFGLRVEPGDVVALVGPSGAGKTTLLEALAHLRAGGTGRILLDGKPPHAWGVPSFRRRVMFVPGRPSFQGETIRDVLRRPFGYASHRRPFDEDTARALLADLGVKPGMDDSARTLSAGEAQRLGLVRALLLEPAFCLLDEPTSALDPEQQARAHRTLVDRVNQSCLGIVLVSHSQHEREALGARTVTPDWIREARAPSSRR